jgi:hypothetical protein
MAKKGIRQYYRKMKEYLRRGFFDAMEEKR